LSTPEKASQSGSPENAEGVLSIRYSPCRESSQGGSSGRGTRTTPRNTGNILLDLKGEVKGEAVIVGQALSVAQIADQLKLILSKDEIRELIDRLAKSGRME
jgi:hypothetical protein